VALVGDEDQAAAGAQHPVQLAGGDGNVEPVEGLGHGDGVDRLRRQRELLGPAGEEGRGGDVPA